MTIDQLLANVTTLLLPMRVALETFHPATPWALLTLVIFGTVRGTRWAFPALWLWFDKVTPDGLIGNAFQGLPSVLAGALASAFAMGGNYALLWLGALSGALAPVVHHVLKVVPLPYRGAVRKIAGKVGIVAVVLLLAACSGTLEPSSRGGARVGARPPTERCIELDERHASASAVAAGSGVLAGASGLASIPTGEIEDQETRTAVRLSLAVSAMLSGAVAYFAADTATSAATSWARECSAQ